jgi:hypothetical protein
VFEPRCQQCTAVDLISMMRTLMRREYGLPRTAGELQPADRGRNDTTRNSMSGGVWGFPIPDASGKLRRTPTCRRGVGRSSAGTRRCCRRTALEDFELGGKTNRRGDNRHGLSGNATRSDSDPYDLDRRSASRARVNISLASAHRCVGNRWPEPQLRIPWEILNRSQIEVMDKPKYLRSNWIHASAN